MKKKSSLLIVLTALTFFLNARTSADLSSAFVSLKTKNPASQIIAQKVPQFSFLFPEMAGALRLGIVSGNESRWSEQFKTAKFVDHKGTLTYEFKDALLGKGLLRVKAAPLKVTDGLILEIEVADVPDSLSLFWACGASSGKTQSPAETGLKPDFCKDNVFVVERNDVTIFYGESMKLKTINLLFPVETESVLSDAHQQTSPLTFFKSGKKTDAPALSGKFTLASGTKYYICVYRQTKDADYNYSHLQSVFNQAVSK